MDILNRELAVAQAAKIVLKEANKVIMDPKASNKALSAAILPLFGIRWSKDTCQRVGKDGELTKLLYRLRNSALAPAAYQKVSALFNEACSLAGPLPPNWVQWLDIIEKFELDNSTNISTWRDIVQDIRALGYESPLELSYKGIGDITQIFAHLEKAKLARNLWQACALTFMEPTDGNLLALNDVSKNAERLIEKLKGREFRATGFAKSFKFHEKKLNQGKTFQALGPAAKIRALKESNISKHRLSNFLEAGATLSLLKASRKAFKGLASAIRCYFSFCELKGIKPFPIKERYILQWSALFNETATFQQYVNSLRKVCYILRESLDWSSRAVVHAAYGLRLAASNRIRFPNFIRSEILWKLIRFFGQDDEFTHLAYISFLFALRVPSEALPIRRAHKRDEVTLFTPQKEKALIALRSINGIPNLVLKLAWRKHMPGGCIMQRPCFCPHDTVRAKGLCPVHWFWPWVRRSRQCGALLFDKTNTRNLNRRLRYALAKIRIPAANLYSSHGFRRGAAQELKESGSQWPIVGEVGKWKGASFRTYVDLSDELSHDMAQLFIHSFDFDSEDDTPAEPEVHRWVYCSCVPRVLFRQPNYPSVWVLRIAHGCFGFFYFSFSLELLL